jgi:hypothetical protein
VEVDLVDGGEVAEAFRECLGRSPPTTLQRRDSRGARPSGELGDEYASLSVRSVSTSVIVASALSAGVGAPRADE